MSVYCCQWELKSDTGQAGKNWLWASSAAHLGTLSLTQCGEQHQELTGFLESEAYWSFSWTKLPSVIRRCQHLLQTCWCASGISLCSGSGAPSFPAAHPVPGLPPTQPRPLPHHSTNQMMAVGHQSAGGWYIKYWPFFQYKTNVQTFKLAEVLGSAMQGACQLSAVL